MIDVDAAMAYLGFVEARHEAWERRQRGEEAPWTDEPIVASRKFTNVFRILDHGTQFILTDLAEPGLSERDLLMRLFLYRHTGRVEAWQYLEMMHGYPTVEDLPGLWDAWSPYRGEVKVSAKSKAPESSQDPSRKPGGFQTSTGERPIFTSAYLVFPQSQVRGTDKLKSIIDLVIRLFTPGSPDDIVPRFLAATSQAERFAAMKEAKGVGDFMAMQVLTDWGYTTGPDREDEFVVLGPGAVKGAKALDPTAKPMDVFAWAVDAVRGSASCPVLEVHDGVFRVPSYMDLQNTLCEFSKHVRFSLKPAAPPYVPAHPGPQPAPVLPKHW